MEFLDNPFKFGSYLTQDLGGGRGGSIIEEGDKGTQGHTRIFSFNCSLSPPVHAQYLTAFENIGNFKYFAYFEHNDTDVKPSYIRF